MTGAAELIREFEENLIKWKRSSTLKRQLPWRSECNPWRILVAEILLQQTDAPKAAKVYPVFISRWPRPEDLSKAELSEVEEVLRPIGLYRWRARRLVRLAKKLVEEYEGQVPDSLDELKKLPGVNDYIAAAVLLFAYGQSTPLVDVNIARVIARFFLGREAGERYMEDKEIWAISSKLTWTKELAYSILDFGWAVCKKRKPACNSCPLRDKCSFIKHHLSP